MFDSIDKYESASSEKFKSFMGLVTWWPTSVIGPTDIFHYCMLRGTALYECRCANNAHNRLKSGNMRTAVEKHIIDFSKKCAKDQTLRVLSVGAEGYLQEFILLSHFVLQGHRNIELVTIAPSKNKKAYQDFEKMLRKMCRVYPGLQLVTLDFPSINDVSADKQFHIVSAIDFDDYYPFNDYSTRQLYGRAGTLGDTTNKAAIDYMKAISHQDSIKSMSILSRGKNLIKYDCRNNVYTHQYITPEFHPVDHFFKKTMHIKAFYLNASIGHILYNLPALKAAQKELVINSEILSCDDQIHTIQLLRQWGISNVRFASPTDFLETLRKEDYIALMDYTVFDPNFSKTALNKNKDIATPPDEKPLPDDLSCQVATLRIEHGRQTPFVYTTKVIQRDELESILNGGNGHKGYHSKSWFYFFFGCLFHLSRARNGTIKMLFTLLSKTQESFKQEDIIQAIKSGGDRQLDRRLNLFAGPCVGHKDGSSTDDILNELRMAFTG